MPSYETLDAIADAYTPLLALISIAYIVSGLFKAQWKLTSLRITAFAAVAGLTYGLMFLDNGLALWPSMGLDYSTHTALALCLVIFLCLNAPRWKWVWAGSLLCYVALMLHQGYHTLADIFSTALVVGGLMGPIAVFLRKHWHSRPASA